MLCVMDAKHPVVPIGGAGENGSLRMIKEGGWPMVARVC